MQFKL